MGEPVSTSAGAMAVAGAAGLGLAGFIAGINGEALTGALLGSLIYFTTTRELRVLQRLLFFLVSFVMGYLFSPAIVDFEVWGMRPFAYPAPAGFAAALLVVTVSLGLIKRFGDPAALERPRGQ
ncbi:MULTISPECIES: putative holin [unclassified Pseudomonas]|uniref:putative holin n=1 Tax=unclassified Pseudomonas TaxID=196821 RepID=UPI00244D4345|nr:MULTISPECIES: putative holin [unclassified Pseudomonas]MDH0894236.1 phage holin family protein [Pseudomonas sp. GD03875]MDH1063469.1 phage holin family protein [Pseudomonas sp. GD03985]